MIPIHHKRMAFKYAVLFLQNEIDSIEETLTHAHLLESSEELFEKRLSELKNDLEKIERYELHD